MAGGGVRDNAYKRGTYMKTLADDMRGNTAAEKRLKAAKYREAAAEFLIAAGYEDADERREECEEAAWYTEPGHKKRRRKSQIEKVLSGDESVVEALSDARLSKKLRDIEKNADKDEAARERDLLLLAENRRRNAYQRYKYTGNNPFLRFLSNSIWKKRLLLSLLALVIMGCAALIVRIGVDGALGIIKRGEAFEAAYNISYAYVVTGTLTYEQAVPILATETNISAETAAERIDCFKALYNGELYEYPMNPALAEIYLGNIIALEGRETGERAVSALDKHIGYLEAQGTDTKSWLRLADRMRSTFNNKYPG